MRALSLAALLACLLPVVAFPAPSPAKAGKPDDERGSRPELILPGDHEVRPAEWIELRWTRTEAVTELEILLSLDGGRHFDVCISPQLDPGRCGFRWQVPQNAAGDLRMRIRFNRDGREIEGAPTAPLKVTANGPDPPQPLGLPLGPGGAGTREPRPAGERSEAPGNRASAGAVSPRGASDPRSPATWRAVSVPVQEPMTPPPTADDGMPFAAPRALPLRS
jgi:hypothetical protein